LNGFYEVSPGSVLVTLAGIRSLMTEKTKFVIRTNLSSMWNFWGLRQWLKGLTNTTGLVAGHWGEHQGDIYPSGNGVLMSRDVADQLLEDGDSVSRVLLDDLAFGEWFQRRRYRRGTDLQRCDCVRKCEAPPQRWEDLCVRVGPEIDKKKECIFFRVKTENDWQDAYVMSLINFELYGPQLSLKSKSH
jgi:hypothetical protein